MNLVLICDDLIQFGGQERLVTALMDAFPHAPLYTSTISKRWRNILKNKPNKIHTSFLQNFPLKEKLNKFYAPFLLYNLAFESFDFSDYDVALSISSRFSHHIKTKPGTKHICYMNSPGRMFWEPNDYFKNQGKFGVLSSTFLEPILRPLISYIRMNDYTAAQKVDKFVANSKVSQERIKRYYNRNSDVIYPFIKFRDFENIEPKKGEHYLVVSRLVPWKKIDLTVKACNDLKLPLKIIGEGPDKGRLQKIASDTIEFLGYVSDEEKRDLMSKSIAFINPQLEDFGITPLESMACGKPVIAYGKGGVLETVINGKTGIFFSEQSEASLKGVLQDFKPETYDPNDCKARAAIFDINVFLNKISKIIA